MGVYVHGLTLPTGSVGSNELQTDSVGSDELQDNSVGNTIAADVASATIKGRITAGSGDPEDLTPAQVRSVINVADGATANASDATLLSRANHTGTQAAATISDFTAAVQAVSINSVSEDTTPSAGGVFNMNAFMFKMVRGAAVASASALIVGDDGNSFAVTGTTTINTIGSKGVGTIICLRFSTVITLTNSANLMLPTNANIVTASGDVAYFQEFSTGNWRCDIYTRDNGTPLALGANTVTNTIANDMAANTIKANNTASTADPSDVTMATNTVLVRQGANITALSMGASTMLMRASSGDILAGTPANVKTLLGYNKIVFIDYIIGSTVSPTTTATTSGTAVVIAQMTKTFTPASATNWIDVTFTGAFLSNGDNNARVGIFIDGVLAAETERRQYVGTVDDWHGNITTRWRGQLSVASHTITVRMWTNAGTLTAIDIARSLIVSEVEQ
jgi:hypothetical protein